MGAKELTKLIKKRWAAFTNFKRKGHSGKIVMSTKDDDLTDLIPGKYNLNQLVKTQYQEVSRMNIPRHAVLKQAKWIKAKEGEKEGKFVCSTDWDGVIPVDIGTNQLLSYYGACLVGEKEEKIALSQRHCTVNFTYSKCKLIMVLTIFPTNF